MELDVSAPSDAALSSSRSLTASSAARHTLRRDGAIIVVLALMTCLAYAGVVRCEFVDFDDEGYVTQNAFLTAGLSADGLRWGLTTFYFSNWHPLVWWSYLLDYQLHGLSPAGFHATNLCWHLANVIVLYVALRQLTGATWPCACAAALFAVHPINTQTVAWVSERKGLVSTFFGILALVAYARYAARPGAGRYACIAAALALSLMAKQMLVTLPFLLLLLDYWPLRRLRLPWSAAPAADSNGAVPLGQLLLEKLPLLVMAALASGAALIAQQRGGAVVSLAASPLPLRVENALVSYAAYLGQLVMPNGLAAHYALPTRPLTWPACGAALLLLALTAAAGTQARQRPYLLVGWLWFVGTLVPVIGLVQIGSQARADRYLYVPAIGLFLAFAWAAMELASRLRRPKTIAVLVAALLLSLLLVTRAQVGHWQDSARLWQRVLEVEPDNPVANSSMGRLLLAHDPDGALRHLRQSVRLDPAYAKGHYNLGVALLQRKDLMQALHHLEQATRLAPADAQAHLNLGIALALQGDGQRALHHLKTSERLAPDDPRTQRNLAVFFLRSGDVAQATAHLRRAAALRPNDPATVDLLAEVLRAPPDAPAKPEQRLATKP